MGNVGIGMTWQPQRDATRYPKSTYADRWRGPAGTLLAIRHAPGLERLRAMFGRGVLACY